MKKILVLISALTFIFTGCSNEFISEDTAKEKQKGQSLVEANNISFNSSLAFNNGVYQNDNYTIIVQYVSYEEYNSQNEANIKNFSEFINQIHKDTEEIEKRIIEDDADDTIVVAKLEKVRGTEVITLVIEKDSCNESDSYTSIFYYLPVDDGVILVASNISGSEDIPKKELKEILDSVYFKPTE